jgi:hypothetical protein
VAGSGSIQALVRDSRGKRGAVSHACKRRRRRLVVLISEMPVETFKTGSSFARLQKHCTRRRDTAERAQPRPVSC